MKVEQLLPNQEGMELSIDRQTLERVAICASLSTTACLARYRLIDPGQHFGALIDSAKNVAPELPHHRTRMRVDADANVHILLLDEADTLLWESHPLPLEEFDYRDVVNVLARFNAWRVSGSSQTRCAHTVDWQYPLIPEANTYRSMFESLSDGDVEVYFGEEIRARLHKMIAPLGLRPPHRRMTCRIPEYPYLHGATSVQILTNAGVVFAHTQFSASQALVRLSPEELEELLQRYVALLQGIQRPIMLGKPTLPMKQPRQPEVVASVQGDLFGGEPIPIAPVVAAVNATATKAANDDAEVDQSPLSLELGLLRIAGQRAELPTVPLKLYPQIKKILTAAGAVYKRGGFDFPPHLNPMEVIELLRAGETINPKKDYQFFETPPDVAKRVVEALGDIQGRRVLEPSAGRGALADLAKAAGADVVTVEAWDLNAKVLRDKGFIVHEADFLQLTPADIGMFDAIVANPPFTRNADIRHVEHMLSFLKPGGVLSTITSAHWDTASHATAARFKQWIADKGVYVEEIPAGAFKSSGTSVPSRHLVYHANKVAHAA